MQGRVCWVRFSATRIHSSPRKHSRTVERRGRVPGMVMVIGRPAEAKDRAVPDHWEGDPVVGKDGQTAVGTLVERSTRFTPLLHLEDKSAAGVEAEMRRTIRTRPAELKRSITWDQGQEMATHANFTVAPNIPSCFCDPHSPWQRGSNENTHGPLRQYLPKGTNLSKSPQPDRRRIERGLSDRPRQTLGYRTPGDKMNELVAMTA